MLVPKGTGSSHFGPFERAFVESNHRTRITDEGRLLLLDCRKIVL
jgi:hypothetical protein